jgi:TonB-linked SusC/RagA family outer membrane protein
MKRHLRLIVLFTCMLSANLFGQQSIVTGIITDKATNEPLPGANVIISGTLTGTVSNFDGEYSLPLSQGTYELEARFIGYNSFKQTVQLSPGQKLTLNFALTPSALQLEEYVVVGYGVQQKSVVTGAISSVKGSDLKNMPITRIEQALQGRTSGITIAASSGQPGAGSTVRVRGTTSINVSDPLYVIDGVPIDIGGLDFLNTADIESMEVLKDAASAAIYGTRAANGVIIVTTKKGKSGTAPGMSISYNAYAGTQAPAKKLDLLNARDYALLRNEAAKNAGLPEIFADPSALGEGTDWQATIFNDNARIQNHELSVAGGNQKSAYYTSIGYFDQEGIVATSISHYKRLSIRLNTSHEVNKYLRIGNNFGYSHIKSKGALNVNSEYGGPLSSAINLDPVTPVIITDPNIANASPYSTNPVVRDENGNPYAISQYVVQEMTNPLAYIATRQGNYGWSDNFVGNFFAELEPIDGLVFRSDLGTKLAFWGDESFTPVYYLNAANLISKNNFFRSSNRGLMWNWENTAAYSGSIGKHSFTALAGVSAFVESSRGTNARFYGLPVNTFDEASMNYNIIDTEKLGGGWESPEHKISSVFARLNYDYQQKYLFTGIVRRDGSSRFGKNNRYGVFPSMSVGWVVSREEFWKANDYVNFLKIRGSYGVNGNDNIADFLYLATVGGGRNYTFDYDNYQIGYSPNAPSNPDLACG